ncbi:MAG: hypothetical protein J6M24_02630 [Lachnospiraceae bacterium]|nr:hypothetical protein [Lachnospiraceae bacterium]
MFDISVYEYSKHLLRNLFVAILMSILCMVATMVYSILYYHYNQYRPFKKLSEKIENGFFAGNLDDEVKIKQINGVDNIYSVKKIDAEFENNYVTMVVYDEWILDNWVPRLKKGKMADSSKNNKEIVISSNFTGVDLGDILTLRAYATADKIVYDNFTVVGILQDSTVIPGNNKYQFGKERYDCCYLETGERAGNNLYLLTSYEAFKNSSLFAVKRSKLSSWAVIEYDKQLNEEDVQEIDKSVKYEISYAGVPYEEFLENSKQAYRSQIFLYIPIFIGTCILILVIILNIVRIEQNMSSRDYGIFYLVGADRRKCTIIRFIVALINMAVSMIISVFFILFYRSCSLKYNLTYHVGPDTIKVASIVYLLLIVINLVFVLITDRGKTPIKTLRESNEKI